MFIQEDILEFLTKIVDQSSTENMGEVVENISVFRDYLKLTGMTDAATLSQIDRVIDCMPEILTLKAKLGNIDIASIVCSVGANKKSSTTQKRLNKKQQPEYEEKHYRHYSQPASSSGCGSSATSYSSSCGGSVSYTSRC